MTEPRIAELFTAIAAFRLSLVRVSGDLVDLANDVEVMSAPVDSAESLRAIARDLAAGLETLTRIADGAQDDTAVMVIIGEPMPPVVILPPNEGAVNTMLDEMERAAEHIGNAPGTPREHE